MTKDQPTCEQRIDGELEDRLERFRAYLHADDEPEEEECSFCQGTGAVTTDEGEVECAVCNGEGFVPMTNDDQDEEESELPDPLSIERQIIYHVSLSTGGPADGFRLTFDPEDGQLIRGEYYFQDWFDGATRHLSDADADMIADAYGIYVEPESRRPY